MPYFWFEREKRIDDLLEEYKSGKRVERCRKSLDSFQFRDVGEAYPDKPIAFRKAYALDEMLVAITDSTNHKTKGIYEIDDQELLVGGIPEGVTLLKEIFPVYLTKEEQRTAALIEEGCREHHSVNYSRLLSVGLEAIVTEAKKRRMGTNNVFYRTVVISCNAVIKYAHRYAKLADEKAMIYPPNSARREELRTIAENCRRVPQYSPRNLWEALQGILIFHTVLSFSGEDAGLGRLDQVLVRYMDKSKWKEEGYLRECTQLVECFLIQLAMPERMSPVQPTQYITVGGVMPDGTDGVNPMSYVILNAFANVDLPGLGLKVRYGGKMPEDFAQAVARAKQQVGASLEVWKDEVMVPGFYDSLGDGRRKIEQEEREKLARIANDYCSNACGRPVCHGCSDGGFYEVSCKSVIQSAMNHEVANFKKFKMAIRDEMQWLTDRVVMKAYQSYLADASLFSSPILSTVLVGCREQMRDAACHGAAHHIESFCLSDLSSVTEWVAAIRTWVFIKKKYTLKEAKTLSLESPLELDEEFRKYAQKAVWDAFCNALKASKRFADSVFVYSPQNLPLNKAKRMERLRNLQGYYGMSLQELFGSDFGIHVMATGIPTGLGAEEENFS